MNQDERKGKGAYTELGCSVSDRAIAHSLAVSSRRDGSAAKRPRTGSSEWIAQKRGAFEEMEAVRTPEEVAAYWFKQNRKGRR